MEKRNKTGRLIVFEGIDGAGKTTLVRASAAYLAGQGHVVKCTSRFMVPELTQLWNDLVSRDSIDMQTSATIAAADYAVGLARVIDPVLQAGGVVLADRYYYSHIAFFHARGISLEWLSACFHNAREPDLIFYLDLAAEEALDRLRPKHKPDFWEVGLDYRLDMSIGQAYRHHQCSPLDRRLMEQHFTEHQTKIRETYRRMLPQERTIWMDSRLPPVELIKKCQHLLYGLVLAPDGGS